MKMIMKKILLIINNSLFIISFSIAFVILCRPIYYYHIKSLDLENKTGYTYEEIKDAYDDIINYTVFNKEFKTGKLKYSSNGKSHFKDCKKLFMIDFIVLGITTIVIMIKKKLWSNIKRINFWSSIVVMSSFTIILLSSLIIGFDKCFKLFHKIFFYGKTNWMFNPYEDEIIILLPKEYFMNCSIIAISIIFIICITNIIIDMCYNSKKEVRL